MHGKLLTRLIKTRPQPAVFTLCLPGSPKVNAGGACGAWLPGRELLRISASTTASRKKMASQSEVDPEPGITETSRVPDPARLCAGTTFDELVQWMVQDASLDRYDRWGPKLT
jgi:hypothetical protein